MTLGYGDKDIIKYLLNLCEKKAHRSNFKNQILCAKMIVPKGKLLLLLFTNRNSLSSSVCFYKINSCWMFRNGDCIS